MEATAGSVLESRVWERGRAALGVYKHRQPEGTSLYRLVYQYRDEFERSWEERFQSKYGVLRHEVLEALDEYLNCGILAHGCVQVYCDQCRHSEVLGFSCRKRGICPSCGMNYAEYRIMPHKGDGPCITAWNRYRKTDFTRLECGIIRPSFHRQYEKEELWTHHALEFRGRLRCT